MRASAFEPPLRLYLCRPKIRAGGPARNGVARTTDGTRARADATSGGFMYRLNFSSRHAEYRLAVAMTLGVLAACAEPTAPMHVSSPNAIIIDWRPIVLTAQLRAIGNPNEIGNPDEKPLTAVVGTMQLKITGDEETGFVVSWSLHFASPECSAATTLIGGAVMIHDPEDIPSPEDLVAFRLMPPGTPLGCGETFLEGSTSISDALAALMIQDPENFVATFFLEGGRIYAGTLQLGGPDTSTR